MVPYISREDKLPKKGGILPVKLFFSKEKNWSFDKVPRVAGISLSKRLQPKLMYLKLVHWDKFLGILPLSVLLYKCRICNLHKQSISEGISL